MMRCSLSVNDIETNVDSRAIYTESLVPKMIFMLSANINMFCFIIYLFIYIRIFILSHFLYFSGDMESTVLPSIYYKSVEK